MRFTAAELAAHLNGTLDGPDVAVQGLAIDSRVLVPGQLFAAVRAERDGHDFVDAARVAGASAVLVDHLVEPSGAADPAESAASSIVVPDVAEALMALARLARSRLADRVVGVTGSVGKTTTKDLLASVLAREFVTTASEKSFNNELGVPMTLANAADETQAAVIEMGARGAGHIALLCDLARPTAGVVTTVEGIHAEMMGDVEQIALVKGELIESLPDDGLAVLNADNRLVASMADRTQARVLTFGRVGDVRARDVSVDDELFPSFVLVSPWGEAMVRLSVRGEHNVANALAAAAVGLGLDVPIHEVAAGLETSTSSPWRMDLRRNAAGVAVLNDAYNAGPASMAAALRALASLPVGPDGGRRIAVLGLMAELGAGASQEHLDIAMLASDLDIELIAVGTDMYGVEPLVDVAAAVDALQAGGLGDGDAVLVKGSRVAGLERLAAVLLDD